MVMIMKKLAIYTLGLLMAAVSTSCSSGGGGGESLIEATFTTTVSRADVLTELGDGDQMVVYRNSENSISKGTPTASTLVCQNGVWKGVPSLKLNPNETAYFWAIYPFNAEGDDPTAYPISLADQIDVLYSGNPVKATYEEPEAQLTMRHALAIMSFNLESYTSGKLESITIGGPKFPTAGTMRVASGRITATTYGEYTLNCNATLGGNLTQNLFVIPVGSSLVEDVKVTFKVNGKNYECAMPAAAMPSASNTQYVHYLTLTENGLILHADRMEKIDLDEEVQAPVSSDRYGQLTVVHSNQSYTTLPQFAGTNVYGYVYWGDGQRAELSAEATYVYQSTAPYTAVFDLWNADQVQFAMMTGIEEIDFSRL